MQLSFDLTTIFIMFVSLVIAITLHEMMHAYAGLKLGDTTASDEGRISLNPLDHVDPLMTIALPIITLVLFQAPILAAKPVPFNPDNVRWGDTGAAIIALAGPLTNLGLAIIGALFARLFLGNSIDLFNVLTIFVGLNVALFVFNMIPIPPLDGSRVLYAFAPDGIRNFMAQIEQFGFFIIIGLIVAVPAFREIVSNLTRTISLLLL